MAYNPILARQLQAALVARGFDLGTSGPTRDGVDGDVGDRTLLAALSAISARTSVDTPLGKPGLTDPAPLFAALKASGIFGAGMTQSQVDGINFKLAAMAEARWPVFWAAAGLGTSYHETGAKMQPVREKGNGDGADADPWDDYLERYDTGRLAAALGNTPEADGDGVFYAGKGDVQITGRANYEKFEKLLGIPLLTNPDLALRPDVSAKIMVLGMERGLFTGKSLPQIMPKTSTGPGTLDQYVKTRPIINGDTAKNGMKIARTCVVFQNALIAGRWNV